MKNRIILFFILVLAVVGFVVYQQRHPASVSPHSVPTSSPVLPKANTYTSPTFGYSITVPTSWITTQANFENSTTSQADRDTSINFASTSLQFTLQTDTKDRFSGFTLEKYAAESVTPQDKITISEVTPFKVGTQNGIREKVLTNDSSYSGLVYFTQDNKNFYSFYTFQTTEVKDITTALTTFRTK